MMAANFPENNLTWQILTAAAKGKYAIGAFNCYNVDGVMAVIRAAERKRSPAMIQLFPWTLHFQGPHYMRYVVAAAHAATVPIAVHLDHCIKSEDIDMGLDLPFDSIMIDASTQGEEDNIAACKHTVEKAKLRGITIEVEMGRIEGGEDGLPNVDIGTVLTTPERAKEFMERTGAHFLAPSFGNVHGPYGPRGAEGSWRLDLLANIRDAVPADVPLVLHGTHPVSNELFRKAIETGVNKININRNARDAYTDFVAANAGSMELTKLKEKSVEVYAVEIERIMELFESAGKA